MENDGKKESFNETNVGGHSYDILVSPYADDFFHSLLLFSFITNAVISLFGIVANVFNIIVFIHQGFKETINISLTALAVSDLASLVCLFWICVCHYPEFNSFVSSKFNAFEIAYLTGGIPRSYFTMVGGWITSFIAVERCICVIRPLDVKFLFTKFRLVVVLAFTIVLAFVPALLFYYTARLTWKHDAQTNTTIVGLGFTTDRVTLDIFSSTIAVVMTCTTFVIVCICTAVINVTMAKQTKWRTGTVTTTTTTTSNRSTTDTEGVAKEKSKNVSSKDAKATRTVTLIAAVFIVCYFPSTVNKLVMAFISEYSKNGRHGYLFELCWSFSFMAEAISSGANIFVYSTTSTKFNATLMSLLRCRVDERQEQKVQRSQ